MDRYLPGGVLNTSHVPDFMTETLTKTGVRGAVGEALPPCVGFESHTEGTVWSQQSSMVITAFPLPREKNFLLLALSTCTWLAMAVRTALQSFFSPVNPSC